MIQDHPLLQFIKDVVYQEKGPAISATILLVIPGDNATATISASGVSVRNPADASDGGLGRQLALARALDNAMGVTPRGGHGKDLCSQTGCAEHGES